MLGNIWFHFTEFFQIKKEEDFRQDLISRNFSEQIFDVKLFQTIMEILYFVFAKKKINKSNVSHIAFRKKKKSRLPFQFAVQFHRFFVLFCKIGKHCHNNFHYYSWNHHFIREHLFISLEKYQKIFVKSPWRERNFFFTVLILKRNNLSWNQCP